MSQQYQTQPQTTGQQGYGQSSGGMWNQGGQGQQGASGPPATQNGPQPPTSGGQAGQQTGGGQWMESSTGQWTPSGGAGAGSGGAQGWGWVIPALSAIPSVVGAVRDIVGAVQGFGGQLPQGWGLPDIASRLGDMVPPLINVFRQLTEGTQQGLQGLGFGQQGFTGQQGYGQPQYR